MNTNYLPTNSNTRHAPACAWFACGSQACWSGAAVPFGVPFGALLGAPLAAYGVDFITRMA